MGCVNSKKKNSISPKDMDFLKANTRFDEECILEWYQSFHKDCPTGKITKEEFVKIYEVYFPHGNSVQFVNNFFRTTDKDNNGYIDFKEFLQTMNIINAGTTLEKLSWAFKLYDIGGDGVIRPDEMTQIAQAMYDLHGTKESAEDHVKEIFAKMDTDSNGHVTKEEFLKGILQDAYIRQWSQGSSTNSENQNVTIVVDKPNNPIMEDCSVSASS